MKGDAGTIKPRFTNSSHHHPPGFLLLEACITIAVVSVGLVYLTRSFASSVRALGAMQDYSAAVAVLREQLVLVQAQGSAVPGQMSGRVTEWPSGRVVNREFEWAVDVREASSEDGAPAPVLPITVTVSWTDRRGTAQIEAVTLLPRRTTEESQSP